MFQEMGGGDEPDCASCIPELWNENKQAWLIYSEIQNQVVLAPMGGHILDIDLKAVKLMLDAHEVDCWQPVFRQVVKVARHMIGKINKELDDKHRDKE